MHHLADDTQIFDRPDAFVFFWALKRRESFVSCGLAPVLIWTNDFFGAGSHLELWQSPWPPLIPNKSRRHNGWGGQRFGQIAAKWRIHSDLENFIREQVELNRGVSGPAWGESKAIWREQSFFFFFCQRFQAGGCDP